MRAQPSILVIDDERNFCRVLETKLRRSGFQVETAPDGVSGLQCLLQKTYQLVLLDVRLPDTDGIEALPRLRAASGDAPFIVMTAYEEEGLRTRALRLGAVEVLYKPFDLDALVNQMHQIFQSRARVSAVHLGQAVTLQIGVANNSVEYLARVTEQTGDTFAVAGSYLPEPAVGRPVEVRVVGEDGLYQFRTRILSADPSGGVLLAKPNLIRRQQRRKYARIPLQVPARLFIEDVFRMPGGTVEIAGAALRNLSLGGAALLSPQPIAVGMSLRLSLSVPTRENPSRELEARGTVLRVDKTEGSRGETVCMLGLRFTYLAPEMRALLHEVVLHALHS